MRRFFYVTFFGKYSVDLTNSFFSHSQQIITQDFARNQVSAQPPQQPPTSTFQNSPSALVSTPVRPKTSNRYSPESQPPSVHHQRPGSRVSPENLVDKPRGRYGPCFEPCSDFPTVKQFEYVYKAGDPFLTPEVSLPSSPGTCARVFLSLFLGRPIWAVSSLSLIRGRKVTTPAAGGFAEGRVLWG